MRKHLTLCLLLLLALLPFNNQVIGQQEPSIQATKTLLSVTEIGDSLSFLFEIRVDNTGNTVLGSLRLNDRLPFPAGTIIINIVDQPSTGTLVANSAYDGDLDRRLITPASGNTATMFAGSFYTVRVQVMVGFDDYYATPKPIINVARAISLAEPDNIEDFDRVPLNFGLIRVIKDFTGYMEMGDSVLMDFNFQVVNTGTLDLDSLLLRDVMPFGFGSKTITIVRQPTSGVLVPNNNFDGINNFNITTVPSGWGSVLACRDTFEVDLSIKVHKDSIKLETKPITNIAIALGDDPDGNTYRDGDRIALYVSLVTVTKALSNVTINGDSAMFTFHYELINCGSDTLGRLRLNDKLSFKGGSNVITVVKQPSAGMMAGNSATPYTGNGIGELDIENNLLNTFSGGTGILYPGDTMEVELQVKTDVCEYVELQTPLFNTASGSGRGIQTGEDATDRSDDRTQGVLDAGTNDDPTPLPLLPKVEMRKTLEDFAIDGDSVKFTFNFVAKNIGNDTLDRIRINDRLPFTGGTNMITIIEQPSEGVFLPNPGFTGNGEFITSIENDLLNTFDDAAGRRLYPGDSVEVQLMVRASLCMYNNLMLPQDNPARATVDGVTTDIRVRDMDFALLPPLPGITLNKSISTSPAPIADDEGLFTATVILEIRNSGNTHLTEFFLTENFADHFGCAFTELLSPPQVIGDFVTGDIPVIQMDYTGDGDQPHIIAGSGFLNPGDSLAIAVELLLDPRCEGVSSPLINSAYIEAYVVDDNGEPLDDYFGRPFGTIDDVSDDHTDFDMDMVPDNDSGEKYDPTRLYLPNLAVTKAFTEMEKLVDDDLLLTFEFEVRNTGNTLMDSLMLDDEIEFFPAALGSTPGIPSITFTNVDANTLPVANALWDGYNDTGLWDGESGVLLPGQSFLMTLQFEINPYAYTAIQPQPRLNFAIVGGLPKEATGARILNPDTGTYYEHGDIEDQSDDGTELEDYGDPLSDNPGAWGEGLGDNAWDDPTPVNICKTYCEVEARELTHISLGQSCMLEITASMVGIGIEPYCDYYYTVRLLDHHDNPFPSNKVDHTFLGEKIKVEITEPECGNVSWGYALIEDKLPPVIECEDVMISCVLEDARPVPPPYDDNCGEVEIFLRNNVFLNMPCHEEFTGRFVRTWEAVDAYGNKSEPCVQTVTLKRVDLGGLTPPPHVSERTRNPLECGSGFAVDRNGNPHPSVTGVPKLDGVDIYPLNGEICNGYVDYEDKVKTDPLGCETHIQRTWYIGEWHCSETIEKVFLQFIDIVDTRAPVVTYCPDPITISTDARSCEGTVTLPEVEFYDECGTDVHVHMQTPNGTLLNTNGGMLTLSPGWYSATYEVWDDCHNLNNDCSIEIHVVDRKNPVAICDKDLAVSLNGNGYGRMKAEVLDLESFDDCSKVSLEIRRVEDNCDNSGTDWAEEIYFCCEDLGMEVMVALQVTDKGGNTNICMTTVEVQDKKDPVMTCIDNRVITCADTWAMNNLSAYFGFPTYEDNCPSASTIRETYTSDIDQCGLGSIHRVFTLIDNNGREVQTCEQWITIESDQVIKEEDIDWPDDFETEGACLESDDLHPDNLDPEFAYPVVPDGFCNLVGWKYSDEVYDATTGSQACFKIIRTWKVIDWCNASSRERVFPSWEKEQIILVYNGNAPTILSDCDDILVESAAADCGDVYVELTLDAEDDCTPFEDLLITWEIDEDDDGDAEDSGIEHDASGTYPLGTHRIYWQVEDRCGGITRCDYTFEVRNTKAATPICLFGVSVDLVAMDTDNDTEKDTAMAMLTPDMIDGKSEHPCGYDLQLSFSPDVDDEVLVLGCDDVGEYNVELWVTASNGAQSHCETVIQVTANGAEGFCGEQNGLVTIEGEVYNMARENIEGVQVDLVGSELPTFVTESDGAYAFPDMPVGGSYEVLPHKKDDVLNGVSTLDIVMITRHVLGIQDISSPYLMMAADINNNGSISATDIIELRKVILGHYDSFPNHSSWMFVSADQGLDEGTNPFEQDVIQSYDIAALDKDMVADFVGVKVGDISGDAAANARMDANTRYSNEVTFDAIDRYVHIGELVEVTIKSSIDGLAGWQAEFTLEGLEVVDVHGNAIGLDATRVFVDDQLLRMSINNLKVSGRDVSLFTLTLKANADGHLSDMISITHDRFHSEAYTGDGLEVNELSLQWADGEMATLELAQNQPNPWMDETLINFTIPGDGVVVLNVRDITGKTLWHRSGQYASGKHSMSIRSDELKASGVLIYELVHNGQRIHKRMIKVK